MQGGALHIRILALLSALTGVVVQDLIITTVRATFTLARLRILVESRWTVTFGALTTTAIAIEVHSIRAAVVVAALTATRNVIVVLVVSAAVRLHTATTTGHRVELGTILCTVLGFSKPSCLGLHIGASAFTSFRVWIQVSIALVVAFTAAGVWVKPLVLIAVHPSAIESWGRDGRGRECC